MEYFAHIAQDKRRQTVLAVCINFRTVSLEFDF